MNKISKFAYSLLYELRIMSSVSVAKRMGVDIGDSCRVLDNPFKVFGTEPYLIQIGNHVELTSGVRLITHDGALWVLRMLYQDYKQVDRFERIVIGNNVFIGVGSVVLPGVKIGNNVIIGAGSVVTSDIGDNMVCAGTPAKPINTIDSYASKISEKELFNTKNMSIHEKKAFLKRTHPEWFAKEDKF